jgi:tetratricopeptide (TPR) repeat protein
MQTNSSSPKSPSPKPPSLCVIVLARTSSGLEASVRSARQLSDSVYVACASPDAAGRVRQVSERLQVTEVDSTWSDSLAHLRNDAMRQAEGDWILWLEDGETLTPASVAGIQDRVKSGELDSGCVYYLAIQLADPASESIEQQAEPRLLPNRPGLRYAGRVAENISKAVAALELEVDGLAERIDGVRVDRQLGGDEIARQGLYLCEREVQQLGPSARTLNHCAECWEILEEVREAQACYRQAVGLADKGSTDQLRAYHGLIGLAEEDPPRQLELCRKASEQFPMDMPILCVMAMALQAVGQEELSLRCYATAFRYGQINPELWHTDHLRDHAARCFALMLRLDQRSGEAMGVLEEAYFEGLQSPSLSRQLLELFVHNGKTENALKLVDTLDVPTQERVPLNAAIRGASLAAQKNWIPARAQLETAYRAGCHDTICLRGLATCYLALGLNEEAEDLSLHWISLEPESGEARLFTQAAQKPNEPVTESRNLRIDLNERDERGVRPESSEVTSSTESKA